MLPYTLPTFAFVAGFAMAQTPQWRPVWPANPSPVSGSEIAYDHLRDRLLVFGGAVNHVPSALCITFDGTSWTGGGSGPPARLFHKLAFDARRGEILLVGGDAGFGSSIFTDTWVWSGGWVQRFPQTPPPAVTHGFSLTYDEDREVVVLYQGQSLYEWDGVNWLRRTPPGFPTWRTYHAAA